MDNSTYWPNETACSPPGEYRTFAASFMLIDTVNQVNACQNFCCSKKTYQVKLYETLQSGTTIVTVDVKIHSIPF